MTGWTRPYVDRPVGDAASADRFAADAAACFGLPDPERLRLGMNALYLAGDVVLRIGRPTVDPRWSVALAHQLLDLGIPAAAPADDRTLTSGDLAATCWVRIRPTAQPVDWQEVGRIVRRVHAIGPEHLPAGYPVPSPATFPWWDFETMRADVAAEIDAAALAGLDAAIERHLDWIALADSESVVCHGDVHPGNVLMTDDGPVLLDWDLLCRANPGWDHAMLLTLDERWGGDPGVYPAFAAGYGDDLRGTAVAGACATLRNVAATLMRVRAGRTDPAAGDEAERRLRFWRGDPDAPMWRSQ